MNKLFMKAEEIQEELGISKTYAYKIIKELNEELEKWVIKLLQVVSAVNSLMKSFMA